MSNQTPSGYDPVTLNHWLWYQYKCFTCAPDEFQNLFELIIKRTDAKFVKIKPWGNLGDRKTDGLFVVGDSEIEAFQVYAPEKKTLAKLKSKIDQDLDGAVAFWSDGLKSWVFVYNVGRGIAADVIKYLQSKSQKYAKVKIDQIDSDELWEMARKLTLQQRAEILGAPTGYEYLFLASSLASEETKELFDKSWFVVVQDVMSPVNIRDVVSALEPELPFGAPFYIRPDAELGWNQAAEQQKQLVKELRDKTWDLSPRYAVFSLAPIPLVIQLGFLLTDQIQVNCFQFDRVNKTWRWPDEQITQEDCRFQVTGIPETTITEEVEIAICVSLSAEITPDQIKDKVDHVAARVNLSIEDHSKLWLKHPKQLTEFGREFLKLLENTLRRVPNCKRIHLFYSGPTGGAIIIGQSINPRMCPPVVTYQFSAQKTPPYEQAIVLTKDTYL